MEKHNKARKLGGGGHRITLEEQNRRIEQLEICLAQGWHNGEIKRTYTALWNISRYSVERYLRRARENLRNTLGETRDEHRARSLHLYRSFLQNPKASDKISA
jgi:hypothetical protein